MRGNMFMQALVFGMIFGVTNQLIVEPLARNFFGGNS